MKSKFINVLIFAAGAAVGSAVTYKVLKTKYDQIVQDEIDSVREAFSGADDYDECDELADGEDLIAESPVTHIDWSDYEDLEDEKEEYADIASQYTSEEGGVEKVGTAPYVIGPFDFGTIDDYYQIELTYYADGVLEDAEGNIITDVDDLVGTDSLYTFGEYEDDAVHVRNERLRTDFEILKDYRTYDEARSTGPGRVADE